MKSQGGWSTRRQLLARAWSSAIKATIWNTLVRHKPGPAEDIALFSTRRSGSTWFMELIAANHGVLSLDQPLSPVRATPGHLRLMPLTDMGQFVGLDEAAEEMLGRYVDLVLDGTLVENAPWRFWTPAFRFRSRRLVLKILSAKPLIDWFASNYPLRILFTTRHPIPTALSIMRNGWRLTAGAYLREGSRVLDYLSDDQVTFAHDTLRSGSPLEQHVLNWGLENLVPLRLLADRPDWVFASYEQAVLDPESVITRLAGVLELRDVTRMRRAVARPSKSTRRSSLPEVRDRIRSSSEATDRAYLVRRWRDQVSAEDERSAFRILERLDIEVYVAGEDLPTPSALGKVPGP